MTDPEPPSSSTTANSSVIVAVLLRKVGFPTTRGRRRIRQSRNRSGQSHDDRNPGDGHVLDPTSAFAPAGRPARSGQLRPQSGIRAIGTSLGGSIGIRHLPEARGVRADAGYRVIVRWHVSLQSALASAAGRATRIDLQIASRGPAGERRRGLDYGGRRGVRGGARRRSGPGMPAPRREAWEARWARRPAPRWSECPVTGGGGRSSCSCAGVYGPGVTGEVQGNFFYARLTVRFARLTRGRDLTPQPA